jgi:pyruvate/2-oxoglutarate dehydrogenase complex dihydrolipoamide acyltransferase (E2) component
VIPTLAALLAAGATVQTAQGAVGALCGVPPAVAQLATRFALGSRRDRAPHAAGLSATVVLRAAGKPDGQPGTHATISTIGAAPAHTARYLTAAVGRLATAHADGPDALAKAAAAERRYAAQHVAAQRGRIAAAAAVDRAARENGQPGARTVLLGWYLGRRPDGTEPDHTPECELAAGTNFRATQMPAIGWPGSVHPTCYCRPGPAHVTARSTYDVPLGLHDQPVHPRRASA